MTQAVYSSAQVARMLGVSGGMVRRYAMALEELTGEAIPQHARDGRQFTQEHVDALVSARRFVAGRQGMSVETGLRLALGLTELPAATPLSTVTNASGTVGAEALTAALGEHIGPLLTQLQTLTEEVAARHQGNHAELVEVLQEAVTELRNPNAALLFAALSEAVTRPLAAELRELRAAVEALQPDPDEMPELPDEAVELINSLRSELERARRDSANVQALRSEVEALRSEVAAPQALPPAVDAERIDRVLAAEMEEGRPPPEKPSADTEGNITGEIDGGREREATDDGLLVRGARWLERRLRGRR